MTEIKFVSFEDFKNNYFQNSISAKTIKFILFNLYHYSRYKTDSTYRSMKLTFKKECQQTGYVYPATNEIPRRIAKKCFDFYAMTDEEILERAKKEIEVNDNSSKQ